MRLKILKHLFDEELFSKDKALLAEREKTLSSWDNSQQQLYQPQIKNYEDLVCLYVNLIEKNHGSEVQDDFHWISSKILGTYTIQKSKTEQKLLLSATTVRRDSALNYTRDKSVKTIPVSPIDKSDLTIDQKK